MKNKQMNSEIRVQFYYMDMGLYRKSYIQDISKAEYNRLKNMLNGPMILEIEEDDWYGKKLPDILR